MYFRMCESLSNDELPTFPVYDLNRLGFDIEDEFKDYKVTFEVPRENTNRELPLSIDLFIKDKSSGKNLVGVYLYSEDYLSDLKVCIDDYINPNNADTNVEDIVVTKKSEIIELIKKVLISVALDKD